MQDSSQLNFASLTGKKVTRQQSDLFDKQAQTTCLIRAKCIKNQERHVCATQATDPTSQFIRVVIVGVVVIIIYSTRTLH